MNVGVAVSTALAHVFENQIGVALGTSHLLVHAAQRVTSVVVIELGIRADRLPASVSVAFLTRDRDRAMRIGDLRLRTAYAGPLRVRRLLQAGA